MIFLYVIKMPCSICGIAGHNARTCSESENNNKENNKKNNKSKTDNPYSRAENRYSDLKYYLSLYLSFMININNLFLKIEI